jgi:hypothetical protein
VLGLASKAGAKSTLELGADLTSAFGPSQIRRYEVVSRTRDHAHLQGVQPRNRRLVCRLQCVSLCLLLSALADPFFPLAKVLGEMLSSKPLFPGRDYHHQLTLILDVLGTPSLDDFYAISSTRSRDYLRALPFKKKRPFSAIYPNANPLAVDLLEK